MKDPYPLERYTKEAKRLLGVLEKRLEGREYLIDDGYTIADISTFPWVLCLTVSDNFSYKCAIFSRIESDCFMTCGRNSMVELMS